MLGMSVVAQTVISHTKNEPVYVSRIGQVSVHKFGSGLVGKPYFYNLTLVNGGCTNEQDNKDNI